MRIWLVNQYAAPPSRPGITRHYELAAELTALGHDVLVIASSFDHVTRTETRTEDEFTKATENLGGVNFCWLRTPSYQRNSLARVWNMVVFSWRLVGVGFAHRLHRPDVIVGSSPHLIAALSSWGVASLLRVPFVLEVRDLWPDSLIDLGGYARRHPGVIGLRLLERHLYRAANRIITLIPTSESRIREIAGREVHIDWIPNGVRVTDVSVAEWSATSQPFTVLYAGSHGLANGLDIVLDAALLIQSCESLTRPVIFRLLGDGPAKAALQNRAELEGIRNVVFDDPVPKNVVFREMAVSDACMFVLKDASVFSRGVSPNKLFDYMAAAKPIVFSAPKSTNPISESGAGIAVDPGDPQALANAVLELMSLSKEELREIGLRGRRYVESHHNLKHLATKMEAALQLAVDSRA